MWCDYRQLTHRKCLPTYFPHGSNYFGKPSLRPACCVSLKSLGMPTRAQYPSALFFSSVVWGIRLLLLSLVCSFKVLFKDRPRKPSDSIAFPFRWFLDVMPPHFGVWEWDLHSRIPNSTSKNLPFISNGAAWLNSVPFGSIRILWLVTRNFLGCGQENASLSRVPKFNQNWSSMALSLPRVRFPIPQPERY